jgi:hypothetical protein
MDSHDNTLRERRNEHDFGKDKMFECPQKASADIVSRCASIRELKQGSLMIKTGTLQLTHVPGEPSVTISWRNTSAEPMVTIDANTLDMKLKEHLIAKHGVIWVQRRDSFGQPFNDGMDTNSEELSPIQTEHFGSRQDESVLKGRK